MFHVKRFCFYYITLPQKLKLDSQPHALGIVFGKVEFATQLVCGILNTDMAKTILLTGKPGVGKTTVIRDVVRGLPGQAGGFYTEEIRERGRRQGFKIVTLDGQEGILAHVSIKSPLRVSQYGVNLADLEGIGVTAIQEAMAHKDFVIIDEIGKMELFSQAFKTAVWAAIHSDKPVLGTITLRPHPWADRIKALPQVTVIEVTEANRDKLAQQVLDLLAQ
jgi:nucleoside-triphosphatase